MQKGELQQGHGLEGARAGMQHREEIEEPRTQNRRPELERDPPCSKADMATFSIHVNGALNQTEVYVSSCKLSKVSEAHF